MKYAYSNSINEYLYALKNTDWLEKELYKFGFANHLFNSINLSKQTDEEILKILVQSQKAKFIKNFNDRGVNFLHRSAKDPKKPLALIDVEKLREMEQGSFDTVNLDNISMSYTGFSGWLSCIHPDRYYPIPMKQFDQSLSHIFSYEEKKISKVGINYQIQSQKYLKRLEEDLSKYPFDDIYLEKFNLYFYDEKFEHLNIPIKKKIDKIDWVWICQDFNLFLLVNILRIRNISKNKPKLTEDSIETISTIEGAERLRSHLQKERDSNFIKAVKSKAIAQNENLFCEVCGFSFYQFFGELGYGFIEGHHKKSIGLRTEASVTKEKDIALLCSNCHRMIHRKKPMLTIEQLKEIVSRR